MNDDENVWLDDVRGNVRKSCCRRRIGKGNLSGAEMFGWKISAGDVRVRSTAPQ